MWERGDKALVFGGVVDSSGVTTDVTIGTIEEVGHFELLISFSEKSWSGPKRVHKDRCMPILRSFDVPKYIPFPEVGDLVLVYDWKYSRNEGQKRVGTIHSIVYGSSETYAEIMLDSELKKIELQKCFILQRPSKKTKKSPTVSYNIYVTKADGEPSEKIETTATIPSRRNS
ncbi:MAG: hypothetical protein CBB97_00485 [Candidatus Endolissoclinum sp. TMED37]|nr:MAG: hypothetical protein CBB97_00485 [Candidatus Endolissoclinum sp. TMED37]|tara:strand:+ start:2633 stop:3148 length:516 start_codon:yes stop_codon:yes gene_type:complete